MPWEPQWTAMARFKSTAQLLLGEGGGARRAPRAQEEKGESAPPAESSQPQVPNPVNEGIKALKGIFGR